MKRIALYILTSLFPMISLASGGPFGAGIIIGSPTGLSGKYMLNDENGVDAALAWDLDGDDDFHIHGDYLWHRQNIFAVDAKPIDLFFGAGARIKFRDDEGRRRDRDDDDDTELGIRGPVGLRYLFRDPAIEIFGEIALIMSIVPDTDLDFDIGIGARYFF